MPGLLNFTPIPALFGGTLFGLGASVLILTTGRCAGVSGILDGSLRRLAPAWRLTFLAGLVLGGLVARAIAPDLVPGLQSGAGTLVAAGLAVGFGARMGGGCTSGHGIVGNSRLSPRSLVATVTFMATGILTASLARVLCG